MLCHNVEQEKKILEEDILTDASSILSDESFTKGFTDEYINFGRLGKVGLLNFMLFQEQYSRYPRKKNMALS